MKKVCSLLVCSGFCDFDRIHKIYFNYDNGGSFKFNNRKNKKKPK